MADIGGFISAPIKLAALISDLRFTGQLSELISKRCNSRARRRFQVANNDNSTERQFNTKKTRNKTNKAHLRSHLPPSFKLTVVLGLLLPLLCLLISASTCQTKLIVGSGKSNEAADLIRHHAHYMNIVPSTHFHYKEGRQLSLQDGEQRRPAEPSNGADGQQVDDGPSIRRELADSAGQPKQQQHLNSHIYKRSSALISSWAGAHYPPLVGTMQPVHQLNPLSRRMMSEAAHTRWSSPRMVQPPNEQLLLANQHEEQQLAELMAQHLNANSQYNQQQQQPNQTDLLGSETSSVAANKQQVVAARKHDEAELLRQKQHIQYHDQWPSMAGKCHKRTLNFCASVLPFNTTTFPNIIGDTNRFEVKRSLPFFGFLAKSSCNKRLDELLCLLLEPPCSVQSGLAIPPCKKFCRLALEGCNEYIPATLAMSSVFDCRQYPDSNDPNVCINLAQGSKCAADEFKCPDKTCIPRNWLCDGVRDCIFAADEANCTAPTGIGLQTSVCSTEEFKCDGKCVPKAWKCDGERDCLDGTDEEACDQRPRCGPDRFRCADGNGCLPKRWVCDGKAECRDGSDELNCEQLECSENDFKCDNGICIPKLWRCDRQSDCKDGSDERNCIYPVPSSTAAPTTLIAEFSTEQPAAYLNGSSSNMASTQTAEPDTTRPTPTSIGDLVAETTSKQQHPQQRHPSIIKQQLAADVAQINNHYASYPDQRTNEPAMQTRLEPQLETTSFVDESSPIIQQETTYPSLPSSSSSSSSSPPPASVSTASDQFAEAQQPGSSSLAADVSQNHQQIARELKKFDYDIIQSPSPSSSPNLIQINGLSANNGESANQAGQQIAAQLHTQVDFVPQHQQQAFIGRQVIAAPNQRQRMPAPDARSRTFGQVIKASKLGAGGGELQAVQRQQSTGAERVPIYRSLFKTLKGGGRTLGVQGEHARYTGVAVRRRRDRHQQRGHQPLPATSSTGSSTSTTGALPHSSPSPPSGHTEPEQARFSHWTSASPSPAESTSDSPMAPHPYPQFQAAQPVAQPRSHGVASYLQLLQSRYNLRLPRVSPQPY